MAPSKPHNTSTSSFSSSSPDLKGELNRIRREQLLEKNQLSLFVAGVTGVAIKSDMQSMELPFFALTKRTDAETKEIVIGNKTFKVDPGKAGRPTIWDKDILLYCASQITDALNRGETVGRTVRINSYSLLSYTKRGTGGNSYTLLIDAVKRLKGTLYSLEIDNPGEGVKRQWKALGGYIDEATITEYDDKKRAVTIDITLSIAFYFALLERKVLTLDPRYFELSSGLKRQLYLIARKFCGSQPSWSISLTKLHWRVGSDGTLRKFRGVIKELVENPQGLLGYVVRYEQTAMKSEGGKVTFYSSPKRG